MPGRYIRDTAEHCAIMTQTMMVPQWVSISVGVNPGPVNMIGGAVPTWFSPTSVSVFAPAPMFGLSLDMSGLSVNGSSNISYSVTSLTGTWQASVVDSTGNTVASQAVQGTGSYSLDFVPASTTAQFQLVSVNPGGTVRWASPTYKTLTYVAGTVTSLVCNGEKDKYRFGYNGQEKDNEWAGVGNEYNFGARLYDTRVARFSSVDPDVRKYPIWSPYSYAKNDPTRYVDIGGQGPGDKVIIFTGAILVPAYQKVTPTMLYIEDQVAKSTGAVTMYPTTYIENDDNYIKSAVTEIKSWREANPHGKLAIVGYSYGGVVAMKLSRALDKENLGVDLLVTLDAANGTGSDKIDRTIPSNVKKNVNYYETNAKNVPLGLKSLMSSKGGPNSRAAGNNTTQIKNIDDSKSQYTGKEDYYNGTVNHYNIDDLRKKDIVSDVNQCEEETAPPTKAPAPTTASPATTNTQTKN